MIFFRGRDKYCNISVKGKYHQISKFHNTLHKMGIPHHADFNRTNNKATFPIHEDHVSVARKIAKEIGLITGRG